MYLIGTRCLLMVVRSCCERTIPALGGGKGRGPYREVSPLPSVSLTPDQTSHTRRPINVNPPSSMDQSPMLNSRKRPSAVICISANMICSAASQWIGLNGLAYLINLPRWGDPGCDPNATTANFVLSFSFDSCWLRFVRAMRPAI